MLRHRLSGLPLTIALIVIAVLMMSRPSSLRPPSARTLVADGVSTWVQR